MIRCYEFKLKNNEHNKLHSTSKKWMIFANYGFEVRKYAVFGYDYDILGLYVKDENLFGDCLLIDNIFSSAFLNHIHKRFPFRFYPIDYEEILELDNYLYSGFHKVIGLIPSARIWGSIIGVIQGNCYEVKDKKDSYLFYNIWTAKVDNKYKEVDYNGEIREI